MSAQHRFDMQIRRKVLMWFFVRVRMRRMELPRASIRMRIGNARWSIGVIQWL